eukprot:9396531-Pyramimonas_sp.AAC.1
MRAHLAAGHAALSAARHCAAEGSRLDRCTLEPFAAASSPPNAARGRDGGAAWLAQLGGQL